MSKGCCVPSTSWLLLLLLLLPPPLLLLLPPLLLLLLLPTAYSAVRTIKEVFLPVSHRSEPNVVVLVPRC